MSICMYCHRVDSFYLHNEDGVLQQQQRNGEEVEAGHRNLVWSINQHTLLARPATDWVEKLPSTPIYTPHTT